MNVAHIPQWVFLSFCNHRNFYRGVNGKNCGDCCEWLEELQFLALNNVNSQTRKSYENTFLKNYIKTFRGEIFGRFAKIRVEIFFNSFRVVKMKISQLKTANPSKIQRVQFAVKVTCYWHA